MQLWRQIAAAASGGDNSMFKLETGACTAKHLRRRQRQVFQKERLLAQLHGVAHGCAAPRTAPGRC